MLRTGPTGSDTVTESYSYTYYATGAAAGLMKDVTLQRKINTGSYSTIRKVEYTYHDGSDAHGNDGDLKTAVIKDGAGTTLEKKYYRYYTTTTDGFIGAVKYVVLGPAYARMELEGLNPLTASNADVGDYADFAFKYDSTTRRVTEETVQGLGCSCKTEEGRTTYTYTYGVSSHGAGPGYNNWDVKTTEKQLDESGAALYEKIVYTNAYGQIMGTRFRDPDAPSVEWLDYWEYDGKGRLLLHAGPSAVDDLVESEPDLVDKQGSQYTYIHDTAGLVEKATYYGDAHGTSPGYYDALPIYF